MAMLHASNLTIKSGFTYFTVVRNSTFKGRGESSAMAEAFINGLNGQNLTVEVPITKLLIRCYSEMPFGSQTFNAKSQKAALVDEYHL